MMHVNEKGQSLVGVVVAMGIMGILSLALCDLTVLMTKNNATAVANSDILAYVNQIRVNLQDPVRASTMLAGNKITSPVVIKDPVTGTVLAQAGLKQNIWSVKRVSFENVLPGGAANLYRMTVVLVTEKVQSAVIGPAIARRVVGDVYCFVAAGVVTTCMGSDPISSAKVQCQALGGKWTDAAAFGSQCNLKVEEEKDSKDGKDGKGSGHGC